MIEVESKIKIKNPKRFKKDIHKLAKFKGKIKKIDDYYSLSNLNEYPKKSLRIRKVSKNYIVNFKKSISYESNIHAKNEVEFNVSDIKNFLNLISDFGFKKWLRKEKTTYLYNIKPNFNIELNSVKGLGWFLEFEYLVEKPKQIKKARKEILRVMKFFGFSKKDAMKSGYTKLLWKNKKSNVNTISFLDA